MRSDKSPEFNIPVPRMWPRRVRSAAIHAVSMAQTSLTLARGWAANSANERIRLKTENDQLRQEVGLLREEMRIKDARMLQIAAQRRPHYPPTERLAILELRAARAWSLAKTAEHLLVTTATVASWNGRLDEDGADALVQMRRPVNRYPEFVAYLVKRLKVLCPTMGKTRIANVLCRAGLHLGSTTVRRMLQAKPNPASPSRASEITRVVTAKRPSHVLHVDLTTVPTGLGFWIPWLPWALPQRWPFCWWVAVAVDHFSRRAMASAVFRKQPSSAAVQRFLDHAISRAKTSPKYLITDRGPQFDSRTFRRWAKKRGVTIRFGAIGMHGSIAVVERFIKTLKVEGMRQILVPFRDASFRQEMLLFANWYNASRPHTALHGRTPDEVYFGRRPASRTPRFEPRARWPRRSPCAAPLALIRGRPGARIEMTITYHAGRKHLPIVSLHRAA